ncbi:hypothetical protein [Siminovitchia terrae]|uniref:hypothetical protein n=1 Tax=Siminovitchia terrae TaxID=1914933 RepID=UPI0028B09A48|nr:hypothetical protein [Siminovitchia terrae]
MSEWLTTGQMVDRLQVGEVAESDDGKLTAKWNEYDKIVFNNTSNGGGRNSLHLYDLGRRWRILPKFVSFDDAMKAHEAGKVVFYHGHIDVVELWDKLLPDQKHIRVSSTDLGDYSLLGMWKGKWTIEDDSND